MDLVESLSTRKEWRALLGLRNDKRMKAQEFVIRFLAFNDEWRSYQKPLFAFLNKYCEQHRHLTEVTMDRLTACFDMSLANCREIFGDRPFQLKDQHGEVQSSFNAALFDAEMVACASLGRAIKLSKQERREFDRRFISLQQSEDFTRAISRATSDEQSVKVRIVKLLELFSDLFHA